MMKGTTSAESKRAGEPTEKPVAQLMTINGNVLLKIDSRAEKRDNETRRSCFTSSGSDVSQLADLLMILFVLEWIYIENWFYVNKCHKILAKNILEGFLEDVKIVFKFKL